MSAMDSAPSAPKPSASVKLVLLGEAAVGKSSLVLRFVSNDFQENKGPFSPLPPPFFSVILFDAFYSGLLVDSCA